MATYKALHGINVQYRDADATAIEGDVWYNASTGILKMYSAVGAWSSGGNINTARANLGGAGTPTAGLIAGGIAPPTYVDIAETYDGSSWTEVGDLGTTRWNIAMAGTQTATLAAAGQRVGPQAPPNMTSNVEEYNGTCWAEIADVNTGRYAGGGIGTSTAGLLAGGYVTARVANSEEWNGNDLGENLVYTDVTRGPFVSDAVRKLAYERDMYQKMKDDDMAFQNHKLVESDTPQESCNTAPKSKSKKKRKYTKRKRESTKLEKKRVHTTKKRTRKKR